jgi:hypothetical protein
VRELNEDLTNLPHQINRPLSRIIDADVRFARLLDHRAVEPYLGAFLGDDYRHIDNDLYYTYPGYAGGQWHRGVQSHPTGHVVDGQLICPMVKVFFCLNDVGPGQGEFVVIPGLHKSRYKFLRTHKCAISRSTSSVLLSVGRFCRLCWLECDRRR